MNDSVNCMYEVITVVALSRMRLMCNRAMSVTGEVTCVVQVAICKVRICTAEISS